MKLEELRKKSKMLEELLAEHADPEEVLRELKIDFADNFDVFPKVRDASSKYNKAYNDLKITSEKLSAAIKGAEEKNLADESDVELPDEIANYGSADFYRLRAQIEKSYVNLQLIRSEEFRTKQNRGVISTDTNTNTERIVFTSQDLSESFLSNLQKRPQELLTILSGPFDKERMSKELKSLEANTLTSEEVGSHLGTSTQHRNDWVRGLAIVENFPPLLEELKTGDRVVDDLEQVVQAYLQRNGLKQDAAPNVRAVVSILLTQGAGFLGQLEMKLSANFFQRGLITDFSFRAKADKTSVFLDNETGKLRFEAYMERDYKMNPDMSENKVTSKQAEASKLFLELGIEIDMKTDASGNPIFTAGKPDFNFATMRDREFANAYPIRFNKEDFNKASQLDEKFIDSLHPCLNDMAKFGGYASLEAMHREENPERSSFYIRDITALTKFNSAFFETIDSKDEKVQDFFKTIYNDFYEKGKSADEVSKDIFSFAKQRISEIPDTEKLRYAHLLKMGERLSKDKNKVEYRQKAIDILTDGYKEKWLGEESRKIRDLYEKLYEGEITQDDVKTIITSKIVSIVQNELESISKSISEDPQKNKPLDEEKYAYFVNLALDYSVPIPENLLKPDVDHQKIVESLCNGTDSKKALLAASHLNENIYREIVDPKNTPAYFLRRLGELVGLVKPRPELTSREHLVLITKYPDLLKEDRKGNPYQIILKKAGAEEKLEFFPDWLDPREKLSLLCKYGAESSDYSNKRDDSFFKDLDKQLGDLAKQSGNRQSGPSIYQELDQLIMTGTLKAIETIRTKLPTLFSQYSTHFSASPSSINYRLDMIVNRFDDKELRFGSEFLDKLNKDLLALANKGFGSSEFKGKEKQAIEAIIETINTHKDLYNQYINLPEFEGFIKKPTATSESSEIPKPNDQDAVKVTDDIKNVDEKLEKSRNSVDNKINLLQSEVDKITKPEVLQSPESNLPSLPPSPR